jgi:D-glycero-D-manno-heptose 1,7-bisphosphate phosphatase
LAQQAIFLDRDGVVNRAFVRDGRSYPPKSLNDFEFLPNVDLAIKNLKGAGFCIIIVTNQPDVATGIQSQNIVEQMHMFILEKLAIDDIKVCYHLDTDQCNCRKPKPGMLVEASQERGIDLSKSFLVGDRWRDIEAGKAAGCKTVFIDYNYQEQQPTSPNKVVSSLFDASNWILAEASK